MRRKFAYVLCVTACTGSLFSQAPAPVPTPVSPQQIPSVSPYGQQPDVPATVPAPTVTGPPVVAPATPTPSDPYAALPPYGSPGQNKVKHSYGSTYIPVDSWVYEAMQRLYSLGYADTAVLSMRPWTRQSVLHILEKTEDDIRNSDNEEAQQIYMAVTKELALEAPNGPGGERGLIYGAESYYVRALGISGQSLRDSWHLGETINNDYGRPYQPGFNSLVGFSSVNEYGRFSLYVRGEYQHGASGTGYSAPLVNELLTVDFVPRYANYPYNPTLPIGPVAAANPFRLQEAALSFHVAGHEISGGKTDAWLGPGYGSAMAWSNNAEDIYSFRINRVEPLHIPYLSALLGPLRYDFFYGSLKGHTAPNDDWTHSEMFAFSPTANFQFGFQRTIVFGGHGHEPVTLHTFLKGFFDLNDVTGTLKMSRDDPGARFSAFNMSWRLPFLRKYVTFIADSVTHDDVTPPSAPRRAAFRTGLYLSQIPGVPKLDFRIEVADTDPITTRSTDGAFIYSEGVQREAYTNQGVMFGDWIGREGKGGQAWLTYHISGKEWVQLEVLDKKNDKDFTPGAFNAATGLYAGNGGTTQNQVKVSVVKRLMHDNLEVNGWFQYERWVAPVYLPGPQHDTATALQLTFFPGLKSGLKH